MSISATTVQSRIALLVKLNSTISSLARCWRSREALRVFSQIQSRHFLSPDEYSLVGAFTACANLRSEASAALLQLHAIAIRSSLLSFRHVANSLLAAYSNAGEPEKAHRLFCEISSPDVYSRTTLLSAYAKVGDFHYALHLFDQMPQREPSLWNALITGSVENGDRDLALRLFLRMRREGVESDQYSIACILSLCDSPASLDLGRQLHPAALKAGFDSARPSVVNAIVTMYFNVGMVEDAVDLFQEALVNEITYNAVIAGLSSSGRDEEAIAVFNQMLSETCFRPTELTLVSVLSACSSWSTGRQVHALAVKTGLVDSVLVNNAAVSMYSKSGSLTEAALVFERIKNKDLVSWNSLLSGQSQRGQTESGFLTHRAMQMVGFEPDEFTYGSLLACSLSTNQVNAVLSLLIMRGLDSIIHVSNSLIVAYGKHGEIENALAIFCCMAIKNLISWNSILSACTMNGRPRQCLELFSSLMASKVNANQYTLSIVLSTCASVSAIRPGKQVHAHLVRNSVDSRTSLSNALITMYAKCGDLESSSRVFRRMQEKDTISWNAMVAAYAQNGEGERAVSCFREMKEQGVDPDGITFTNVLSGCSHVGLVYEPRWILSSMVMEHGIEPSVDHYSCVIDLLARAGRMEEAESLINGLERVDSRIWWALLSSCVTHGSVRLGKRAAEALLERERENPAVYVLLSNLNAVAGKWEEALAARKRISGGGALKQPGCSWLELSEKGVLALVLAFVAAMELMGCSETRLWEEALSSYRASIESLKKPELLSLDDFYRKELPLLLKGRDPEPYIMKEELCKLMEWKLSRGKWRPRLQGFVSELEEGQVKSASLRSFRALPDLSKAVSELTTLKGVGPATASAVLAAYAPEFAPFMSDEAMAAALRSKEYTLKQYLAFAGKLQEKAKEMREKGLSFSASDVEQALWSYSMAQQAPRHPATEKPPLTHRGGKRKRKNP